MPRQFCPQCAEPVGPRNRVCEECGARRADQRRDQVEVDIGVGAGVSDRGRRHHRNEDALALRGLSLGTGHGLAQRSAAVAVVCDGVSSAACRDEASEIAAEELVAALHADDGPDAATWEAIYAAAERITFVDKANDRRNRSWT